MKAFSIKIIARTSVAVSLIAFGGVAALAGERDYSTEAEKPFQSTKTRAEVMEEYFQARKDGTLPQAGETSDMFATVKPAPTSTLTREEVMADTIEWLRTHGWDVSAGGR
jgi:Domain of unknown function (DUF4148)